MGEFICPWWLAYTFDNPIRRFFHNPGDMFRKYVKPGMTTADIGCGMGYFSIAMADMVEHNGKVIAIDIQQKMLDVLKNRAEKKGMANRIICRKCTNESLQLTEKIDFALAFWMIHEVPKPDVFFKQIHESLKPGGTLFVAEPRFHVSKSKYLSIIDEAKLAGFITLENPHVAFSYCSILS